MPHKKDGEVVGRSTKSLSFDEDMDGMRARVKNLEITLVDFDKMVARLGAVERDLESCKGGFDSSGVRRLIDEEKQERQQEINAMKFETSQKVLAARTGAVAELAELDRKVHELDQGLRHLDNCIIKCSQGFAQFDKEQSQKVTLLQVSLTEQLREIVAKVDVCPPRSEIKMAMKNIQFDMLNHSNACLGLARSFVELKKKVDPNADADDTVEEILRWKTNLPELNAGKLAANSTSSASTRSGHDRTAHHDERSDTVESPNTEGSAGNAHPPGDAASVNPLTQAADEAVPPPPDTPPPGPPPPGL
jgi:hypothetical protein